MVDLFYFIIIDGNLSVEGGGIADTAINTETLNALLVFLHQSCIDINFVINLSNFLQT